MNHSASAEAVFGLVDREMWVVTAAAGGQRGGLIATMVQAASIAPAMPRVLIGLGRRHCTCGLVERSGAFALHLLTEKHVDWVWRFGTRSGRDGDKLAGVPWQPGASGSPILTDALAWLDCVVETTLDTGDRRVFLAEVRAAQRHGNEPPLTMKRLLQLASPEHLRVLKEQLDDDARLDAVDIQAWRGKQ